ncbi:hypothetical protein V1524DRAFT_371986 [Lipomyces starkeyi]
MVKDLYNRFSRDNDKVGLFYGDLSPEAKADVLDKWISGQYTLVFTTSGFGVGLDYGTVSLVIHYDGLWSLQDYVQESGRAGRRGDRSAKALLLLRNVWRPNYTNITARDAIAIDDYVSPQGFCRRYTIGTYMDGFGFSCLTYRTDVELCDICRAAQCVLTGKSTKESSGIVQHAEGPLPRIKRLKADTTDIVKDTIRYTFDSIIAEHGGCALCVVNNSTTRHRSYDSETLTTDHRVTKSLFADLRMQLSRAITGTCHGCGLSLRIVNGISEHTPARLCIYSVLTELICYEIFVNGRLQACIRGMNPGFLDIDDISSFGKWLKVHPIGEQVNNMTMVMYNWVTLGFPADSLGTNKVAKPTLGQSQNKLTDSTFRVLEHLQGARVSTRTAVEGSSQRQVRVRVGGETLMADDKRVKSTIAEKWLQFMNIIRTEFHGCSICAVSKVQQRHGTDDSFNQMLKAHGYHDVNQFMRFERMTYFNQAQAKAICLNCSLPRRLTSSMPSHQGRVCPVHITSVAGGCNGRVRGCSAIVKRRITLLYPGGALQGCVAP